MGAPDQIDAQYRPNPRIRIGGNGGPPLEDPLILEQVFPGLQHAPGGSILAIADNVFDVSGPSQRLTTQMHEEYTQRLIDQIRVADPGYRFQSLGVPSTMEGRVNQIRDLRIDRAVAFHTLKQEDRPLQVETLRFLQERVDAAYEEAVSRAANGQLRTRLSAHEAMGNFVDFNVRMQLKRFYNQNGVPIAPGQSVQVNRRAYDTSADSPSYRVPDARVGDLAIDVTLARKGFSNPQVTGFFGADFKPQAVAIIRPTKLGGSYIIIQRK